MICAHTPLSAFGVKQSSRKDGKAMVDATAIARFLGIPELEVMSALGQQFVPSNQVEARDYYRLLPDDTKVARKHKAAIMRLWRKFTHAAVLSAHTVDEAKSAFFRSPDVGRERCAALEKWLSMEMNRDGIREIVRNTTVYGECGELRRAAIRKLAQLHS